jgi:hypothetical protein
MKLSELKKLSNEQLAERFPFVVGRDNNDVPSIDEGIKLYMNGWTDLLFCWAEKVKPIFDKLDKKTQDNFYIFDYKEKWGTLRLDLSCIPNDEIDKLTTMVEHLSEYCCIKCGKITKTSNGKKLVYFGNGRNWVIPFCRDCSYQQCLNEWHDFGPERFQNWIVNSKKPIRTLRTSALKDRHEGDWFARIKRWKPDGTTEYIKYDCRELLKDMF